MRLIFHHITCQKNYAIICYVLKSHQFKRKAKPSTTTSSPWQQQENVSADIFQFGSCHFNFSWSFFEFLFCLQIVYNYNILEFEYLRIHQYQTQLFESQQFELIFALPQLCTWLSPHAWCRCTGERKRRFIGVYMRFIWLKQLNIKINKKCFSWQL